MSEAALASTTRWLCCQLGAREHYAIPRALAAQGSLSDLVTDAWVRPGSSLGRLQKGLRARFHAELAGSPVHAFNASLITFELAARLRGLRGWPLIMARNRWFQRNVVQYLKRFERSGAGSARILFGYSYAALEPLRWARAHGWKTVLGQIDPGPPEERVVRRLRDAHREYSGDWEAAPAAYWDQWRDECRLADRIAVNSPWSREALIEEGVPAGKIVVLPLAYEVPAEQAGTREYPAAFTAARPLRVLFLGLAIIRKGIHDLIAAAGLLDDAPVVIDVAGPHGTLPPRLPPQIRFHGPVPRGEVPAWYRQADVFVLPTHSDGFAITQLEAMAHGLPVIATPRCGEVVEPGHCGWMVLAGEPQALAAAIREAARDPATLTAMSAAALARAREFSLTTLGDRLSQLRQELRNAR